MKLVHLSRGHFAQVDDADFPIVSRYKWSFDGAYATRTEIISREDGKRRQRKIYLHKFITGWGRTDHVDSNKLNCQRYNLRQCTQKQNTWNMSSHRDSTSKYKGVSWNKRVKKWHAYITSHGKRTYLGAFDKEDEAAVAYNRAAEVIHGDFAKLSLIGENHERRNRRKS